MLTFLRFKHLMVGFWCLVCQMPNLTFDVPDFSALPPLEFYLYINILYTYTETNIYTHVGAHT